ncbi:unnamed protein product [Caenorhabditis sp. 36 PRJEB53466]|nr:unnamed protein product [Caenorhabditis sp. 36 PRJEB53466]
MIPASAYIHGRLGDLDIIVAGWRYLQRTMNDEDRRGFEQMIRTPGFCIKKFEEMYLLKKLNPFAKNKQAEPITFVHNECPSGSCKNLEEIIQLKERMNAFMTSWEKIGKTIANNPFTSQPEDMSGLRASWKKFEQTRASYPYTAPSSSINAEILQKEDELEQRTEEQLVNMEDKKVIDPAPQDTQIVARTEKKDDHVKSSYKKQPEKEHKPVEAVQIVIKTDEAHKYNQGAVSVAATVSNNLDETGDKRNVDEATTSQNVPRHLECVTEMVESLARNMETLPVVCDEEASSQASPMRENSPVRVDMARSSGTPDSGMISDVSEFKSTTADEKGREKKIVDMEKKTGRDGRRYRQQKKKEAELLAMEHMKLEEQNEDAAEQDSAKSIGDQANEQGGVVALTGKEKRRLKDKLRKEKKAQEQEMMANSVPVPTPAEPVQLVGDIQEQTELAVETVKEPETAVEIPTVETAVENPTRETAVENLSAETAVESPAAETAVGNSIVETAAEIPTVETAIESPSAEIAVKSPTRETAVESPTTKNSLVNLSTETAAEGSTAETAVGNPIVETAVEIPTVETAVKNPTRETAVENLSTDTAVEGPTAETAVGNPIVETAVEIPIFGALEEDPQIVFTTIEPALMTEGAPPPPPKDAVTFEPVLDDDADQDEDDAPKMSHGQRKRAKKRAAKGLYVVNGKEGTPPPPPHSVELLPEMRIGDVEPNREINLDQIIEERKQLDCGQAPKQKNYYVAGNLSKNILDNGKWLAYVIDDNNPDGTPRVGEVSNEQVAQTIKHLERKKKEKDGGVLSDDDLPESIEDEEFVGCSSDFLTSSSTLPELDADFVRKTFAELEVKGEDAGEALCIKEQVDVEKLSMEAPDVDDLQVFMNNNETDVAKIPFHTDFAKKTAPIFIANNAFIEFCKQYSNSKYDSARITTLVRKYIDTRIVFHFERFKKLADRESRRISKCWTHIHESSSYALMVMLFINSPTTSVGFNDIETVLFPHTSEDYHAR